MGYLPIVKATSRYGLRLTAAPLSGVLVILSQKLYWTALWKFGKHPKRPWRERRSRMGLQKALSYRANMADVRYNL
ncbi:hypothetical protein CEXT_628821 [Caerostris extrusa]|uniref:Uncharacterized protein n=1 Tax=Caerostris extrusa TaxID=172846 RepID=A0AAV4PAS1_CAEEX|nr:hypothetical protein CEXT_628821 [Caerostris extrusa]